jgi:hypothetical protein
VVIDANQGCQNASNGRLKALYAPQIYPRLINRAQFIVYSLSLKVLILTSAVMRGIVLEFVGFFLFFQKKIPGVKKLFSFF